MPTYQDLARMLVYVHILDVNVDAVKRNNAQLKRAASAIVFSLLMAFVLYLAGFLGGNYLWSRFGPPANDPDETSALICGVFVGGSMALIGAATILRKFWPRA
jgi:ABC-type Mn2+/Zn2+ transport system permease subunit